MTEVLNEYMHTIINIIIFTSAISFLILYIEILNRGNDIQIDNMKNRYSVSMDERYSLVVNEESGIADLVDKIPETTRKPASEVFTDIVGDNNNDVSELDEDNPVLRVVYRLNDGEISPELIIKARAGDTDAIEEIRDAVSEGSMDSYYVPIMKYDKNNELVSVNYRSEE